MIKTNAAIVLVAKRLEQLGFRTAKKGIYTLELSPGALAWVGLNTAMRGGAVEINPVVGVRHQEIERLVAELRGEQFNAIVPATIAANVGYLSQRNRYEAFIFDGSRPDAEVASDIVKCVSGPGLAFAKSNAAVSDLASTLKTSGLGIPHQNSYRLPVALLLADLKSEALEVIDEELGEIGSRADEAALRYVAFAKKFKARATDE